MTGERPVEVARRLVAQVLSAGGADAVLSPGSRSGPLALALHAADAQGLLRLHVRVDEREAGFLALGLSKASGRPVPVVTTSGTAVANLHAPMLEALHTRTPVIAVTADRPARLRGTGANQTTDQRRIFPGIPFIERVDDVAAAVDGTPRHLNLEFEEPLVEPVTWDFGVSAPISPAAEPVAAIAETGPRTVVLAGDGAGERIATVAEDGGWPLLAEPSSGARRGPNALTAYRLLLESPGLVDRIERVISAGHSTAARQVTRLLSRTDLEIVHVGDQTDFPAPAGPNVRFVDAVRADGRSDPSWLADWREADAKASAALPAAEVLDLAQAVWEAASGELLFVGSSNPVRDLDLVADPARSPAVVLANRGLAGIDGVLSSAIGAALARPEHRSFAVVGDLTFLHGSNGLLIGPDEPRPDLTIVVVSDDGGSIFATLEQGAAEYADAFERVYATPTGARIGQLCAGYGVEYRRTPVDRLPAALAEPVGGIDVIETPVSRADRRALAAACVRVARSRF